MTDDQTRIVIKGVRPYDGEYVLDPDRALSGREWRWVKRISGYMPMTINEGLQGDDPDLYIALAVIAMARDGKIERTEGIRVAEVLSEVPFDGAITMVFPEPEADEGPLALTSEPEQSSPRSSLEKQNSSGPDSTMSSERSDGIPVSTGTFG